MPVYAERRRVFDEVMADAMKAGDNAAVVATVIVAAATDAKPEDCATPPARWPRVSPRPRRLVPARLFDRQIRKNNRMPT